VWIQRAPLLQERMSPQPKPHVPQQLPSIPLVLQPVVLQLLLAPPVLIHVPHQPQLIQHAQQLLAQMLLLQIQLAQQLLLSIQHAPRLAPPQQAKIPQQQPLQVGKLCPR